MNTWKKKRERGIKIKQKCKNEKKKGKKKCYTLLVRRELIRNLNCFLNTLWKVPKIKNKGLLNFHIAC